MVIAAGVVLVSISFFIVAIGNFYTPYEKTFDPAISTDMVYQVAEALVKDPGEDEGGCECWEDDPTNIKALGFGKPATMEWYVNRSGGESHSLNTWSSYDQSSSNGREDAEDCVWVTYPKRRIGPRLTWSPYKICILTMSSTSSSWFGGAYGSVQSTSYGDFELVEIKESEYYPYNVLSREKIDALASLDGEDGYRKVKEALGIDPRYDFNISITNGSGTIIEYGKSYDRASVITSLSRAILITKEQEPPDPMIYELGHLKLYIFL
jgi:hypothetical protein